MKTFPPVAAGSLRGRWRLRHRALTLVECLFLVLAVALLFYAVALPHLTVSKPRPRLHCANNLWKVALSFTMFATDNNGRFPQHLSTNEGGVKELVFRDNGAVGDPTRTFWVFVAMSNELAIPKTVVCPADTNRVAISNFYGMAYGTLLAQGGQNASVSYFVNLAADSRTPEAILAGDRNLSYVAESKRPEDYDAFFSVEHCIQPEQVKPGGLYGGLEFHRSIHLQSGYVMLSDGTLLGPTNGAGCVSKSSPRPTSTA